MTDYNKQNPIISFRLSAEIKDFILKYFGKQPIGTIIRSIINEWYWKNKSK